ncbi:serine hydrolase domain-containing protein [Paraferrimonas sedimenticola]|uniref:Serine hydrolase n=1 Tax=Paraferrimonas sedimenticola TaxID=375674 RepID=A0AA37VT77_9GAMM|nr:serine hydrolase domain-containing protein [Paraferrimonas sedimenticola]GLP95141.1 serine hydrolase [Paraferrimonas sedimenticola]
MSQLGSTFKGFLRLVFVLAAVPSLAMAQSADIQDISPQRAKELNQAFEQLVLRHKVNTAGVAVIKNQKVIWLNQFGQESEGVPANSNTLFNLASLTKTITAETILRLVAQGKLSLDESIAEYYVDPDLKQNAQVQSLTPRHLLTHRSGFPNWRYFSKDRKLLFLNPPGAQFGYSGEGFEYLAKYAENKLNKPFAQLVDETLFAPLGIARASVSIDPATFNNIAKPFDQDGVFHGHFCHPAGYCEKQASQSAAANAVISIGDYAKILLSAMQGEGLSLELVKQRNSMQSVQFSQAELDCSASPELICPSAMGYGLGWSMTQWDGGKLIGHRGTNWTVVSLTYFYPRSGDALVILFNAPNRNGLAAMIEALELLDPDSPELHGYKMRLLRASVE